jgi:hypothetical protein
MGATNVGLPVDDERPPSPQMKFFVSWKLSAEKRPKLPSGRPLYRPYRPWALSSTSSARGQRSSTLWMPSMSHPTPA